MHLRGQSPSVCRSASLRQHRVVPEPSKLDAMPLSLPSTVPSARARPRDDWRLVLQKTLNHQVILSDTSPSIARAYRIVWVHCGTTMLQPALWSPSLHGPRPVLTLEQLRFGVTKKYLRGKQSIFDHGPFCPVKVGEFWDTHLFKGLCRERDSPSPFHPGTGDQRSQVSRTQLRRGLKKGKCTAWAERKNGGQRGQRQRQQLHQVSAHVKVGWVSKGFIQQRRQSKFSDFHRERGEWSGRGGNPSEPSRHHQP